MTVHLVAFDLNDVNHAYDPFYAKLRSYESYMGWLKGAWLISTTLGVGEVRNALYPLLSQKDELLVIEVVGDRWASQGLTKGANDWINARVKTY